MINIDQRHRPTHQDAHTMIKGVLMGFIIAIGIIALISDMSAPHAAESISQATYDNLMSTERAEFMMLFEHGEVFDEGDME